MILSPSLFSSLCLSAVSFRASTCPFNLSASTCQSDSHLDHWSLLSAHLCLRKRGFWYNQYTTKLTTNNSGIYDLIYNIVEYLAPRSDGWSPGILPPLLPPCNIIILWFSFLSSEISCWAWLMASHGLAGPGSPDVTEVTPGLIQEMGGAVPGIWMPLCAPADWTFDWKCDGGTRSSWVAPWKIKNNIYVCARVS